MQESSNSVARGKCPIEEIIQPMAQYEVPFESARMIEHFLAEKPHRKNSQADFEEEHPVMGAVKLIRYPACFQKHLPHCINIPVDW